MCFEAEQGRQVGIDHAERPAHLRVTVGFDAGESQIRPPIAVTHRLVDAADMGIAMHGKHLAREFERFLLQRTEKLAIAAMGEPWAACAKPGIGLEEQDDTGGLLAVGQMVETVTQDQARTTGLRGLRNSGRAPLVSPQLLLPPGRLSVTKRTGPRRSRMFGVASGLTRQGQLCLAEREFVFPRTGGAIFSGVRAGHRRRCSGARSRSIRCRRGTKMNGTRLFWKSL